MNARAAEKQVIEVPEHFSRREERELPVIANATPMSMLATAVQRGMDVATIKDLMELQARWEKGEAEKAYNVAFAAFKAEAVQVIKNKMVTDGPLKNKSYAELFSVVDAVTPHLSRHGLSTSWKVTKDDKDWLEVTCTLKHIQGHSESVSLGGPPDVGGAKSAIQARASTVTYLERYTLKAVCGVAEKGDDNDGRSTAPKGMPDGEVGQWIKKIEATTTKEAAKAAWHEAVKAAKPYNDVAASKKLKEALIAHGAFIDKAGVAK